MQIYPTSYAEVIDAWKKSTNSFIVMGSGYSFLIKKAFFNNPNNKIIINLSKLNKIVSFDKSASTISVQAGCTFYDINNYLTKFNCTLATLPEFTGLCAGACLATPIHGSNRVFTCLADIVNSVMYLENGIIKHANYEDVEWKNIIFNPTANLIFLEITFFVIQDHYITCDSSWINENTVLSYLQHWCPLDVEYYTITWYCKNKMAFLLETCQHKKLNISYRKIDKPLKLFRFIPYLLARTLYFFKNPHIIGKSSYIFTGWKKFSLLQILITDKIFERSVANADIEFSVSTEKSVAVFQKLNQIFFNKKVSIGIRIGGGLQNNGKESLWEHGRLVWFEVPHCPIDLLATLFAEMKKLNVKFHLGKVLPEEFEVKNFC